MFTTYRTCIEGKWVSSINRRRKNRRQYTYYDPRIAPDLVFMCLNLGRRRNANYTTDRGSNRRKIIRGYGGLFPEYFDRRVDK